MLQSSRKSCNVWCSIMNSIKRAKIPAVFFRNEDWLLEIDVHGTIIQTYNVTLKQHWVNPSYLTAELMDTLQPISSSEFTDNLENFEQVYLAQVLTNTGTQLYNDWVVMTDQVLSSVNRLLHTYGNVGQVSEQMFNKAVGLLDWLTHAPCYALNLRIDVLREGQYTLGNCVVIIPKQEDMHKILPTWLDFSVQPAMYIGNPPPTVNAFSIRVNRQP